MCRERLWHDQSPGCSPVHQSRKTIFAPFRKVIDHVPGQLGPSSDVIDAKLRYGFVRTANVAVHLTIGILASMTSFTAGTEAFTSIAIGTKLGGRPNIGTISTAVVPTEEGR